MDMGSSMSEKITRITSVNSTYKSAAGRLTHLGLVDFQQCMRVRKTDGHVRTHMIIPAHHFSKLSIFHISNTSFSEPRSKVDTPNICMI